MEKSNVKKEAIATLVTVIAAFLSAAGLWIFVYPSNFAPSGIDGVSAMLQYLTGYNAGLFSLAINAPLLIAALFLLKKRYVIYTIVFTVINSLLLIVFEKVGFYQYVPESDKLISAVFSGVILGVRSGVMLKIGASTGGVDIVACIIQRKFPYKNVERMISILCYVVILASYFVYHDINSILLSIVQVFVLERTISAVLKEDRKAIEFKIITKHPEDIRNEIIFKLKHGATMVESKGMFTEDGSHIIFTVVNMRQIPEFLAIVKKYPDSFAYYGEVLGVNGNFRWQKDEEAK